MPSKSHNGNTPLGSRVETEEGNEATTSRLADEIARRTPRQSMTGGVIQTHNGAIHAPKRFKGSLPAHPWKVTSNGDATVNIGKGSVFSWDEGGLTLREYKLFKGTVAESYTPTTVTGAGSIYGAIEASLATSPDINYSGTDSNGDDFDVNLNRVFPNAAQDFSFSFQSSAPSSSSIFYFELAKVDLIDGVATVTRQVRFDDPVLSSWVEPS